MSSPCLLKVIDIVLDDYIPTISTDGRREEALTLHRGLKSLIAASTGRSEDGTSSVRAGSAVSVRRLEAAIVEARRRQIIDAVECILRKANDAVRSMPKMADNASHSNLLNIDMQSSGAANVFVEGVAVAELSPEMPDVTTRVAQLRGALAMAKANYTAVAARDVDAAVGAG